MESLADAPQKFEQVDGGAEPAVEVDQAPESRDRIVTSRQGRQSRSFAIGRRQRRGPQRSATLPRHGKQRRALWSLSETARERGGASDPPAGPRSPAPRTPPRRSRAAAPGSGPLSQPRATTLTVSAPGRPRPAPERRAADPKRCEVPHRVGKGGSRPSSARSKAPFQNR